MGRVLYRTLLRLFPRAFRAAYAADMERDLLALADATRQRRGRGPGLRFWVGAIRDALVSAARERRIDARLRASRPPAPHSWTDAMHGMLQDLRLAARLLTNRPGFTAVAVTTLAIGIGASTLIFSVVQAVLLTPPPFHDPGRLVVVWERNVPRDRRTNVASPANLLEWRDRQRAFTDLGAFSITTTAGVTSAGREPEQVSLQLVTSQLFPILGVEALSGRTFLTEDDRPDSDVALISHRFWVRRFGGATDAVGRTVSVNGRARTIVGVMPPSFDLFDRRVDLWVPAGFSDAARQAAGRWLVPIGRLKPDVDLARAQADMDRITTSLAEEYPDRNAGWASHVVPIQEQLVGAVRPALVALLGAVGFVLLIACANVANLLLARATARQRELALRTALGATRRRLVRQLLIESATLAMAGAAGGILLAFLGLQTLLATTAEQFPIPRLETASLDRGVLAVTVLVSLAAALVFGLAPALSASRPGISEALKDGVRGSGTRHGRLRSALVVAEVALAIVLVTGAGLLVRSFGHLLSVDPGFRTDEVLTMQVSLPGATYRDEESRVRFFRQLVERLASVPGVSSAGAISFLPLDGLGAATSFRALDRPAPRPGEEPVTDVRMVTGDYFRAMSIPLVRGRLFNETEIRDGTGVVVNEAMVRQMWPDEDPIGKRLVVSWSDPDVIDEVIGVVGDVRLVSLDEQVRPAVYYPHTRTAYSGLTVVVRADLDATSLTSAAVAQVRALDPEQPVANIRAMDEVVALSVGQRRIVMLLAGLFAGVALLLAAVGLYGVLSYVVAERTQEIGVRVALGAPQGAVLGLVVRQALGLVALGALAGLAGAAWLTGLMQNLLFAVAATDPITYAAAVLVLGGVAVAASLVPAWRAGRIDPVTALRAE